MITEIKKIIHLEELLLSYETRHDISQLEALLHNDFLEIGSTWRIFWKDDCLKRLPTEDKFDYSISNISGNILDNNLVQIIYSLVIIKDNKEMLTNRSSLWLNNNWNWQMRFHQWTIIL